MKRTIFDVEIFKGIFDYLGDTEEQKLDISIKGLEGNASVIDMTFPFALEGQEAEEWYYKKEGLENFYQVLNTIYTKTGINLVDDKSEKEEGSNYDFLIFEFYLEPDKNERKLVRRMSHAFIVFISQYADKSQSFRMLFHRNIFLRYTDLFLRAEHVDINNVNDLHTLKALSAFEKLLIGVCKKINLQIPPEIKYNRNETYWIKDVAVTADDFERIISLINYKAMERRKPKSLAKKLIAKYKKPEDESFLTGYFDERFSCLSEENGRDSELRFSNEEISDIIFELINGRIDFNFPEGTYVHEAFPQIQDALSKYGLELMSFDCQTDNYLFFVVRKDTVGEIISLSQKLRLGIVRLG